MFLKLTLQNALFVTFALAAETYHLDRIYRAVDLLHKSLLLHAEVYALLLLYNEVLYMLG